MALDTEDEDQLLDAEKKGGQNQAWFLFSETERCHDRTVRCVFRSIDEGHSTYLQPHLLDNSRMKATIVLRLSKYEWCLAGP